MPQANWLSEQDATAKAAGLGYDVRDFKVEGSCYEIYAMKGDARVQVVMNPATGEIVGRRSGRGMTAPER